VSAVYRGNERPESEFTMVRNAAAEDNELSFRALGLLVWLLSRPPGWTFTIEQLARRRPEGRDAIARAVRELEKAGYVLRTQEVGPGGTFEEHRYWVADERDCLTGYGFSGGGGFTGNGLTVSGEPGGGEPVTGEPVSGEPGSTNKKEDQEEENQDVEEQDGANQDSSSDSPPILPSVESPKKSSSELDRLRRIDPPSAGAAHPGGASPPQTDAPRLPGSPATREKPRPPGWDGSGGSRDLDAAWWDVVKAVVNRVWDTLPERGDGRLLPEPDSGRKFVLETKRGTITTVVHHAWPGVWKALVAADATVVTYILDESGVRVVGPTMAGEADAGPYDEPVAVEKEGTE
jgi:hypothetical protein